MAKASSQSAPDPIAQLKNTLEKLNALHSGRRHSIQRFTPSETAGDIDLRAQWLDALRVEGQALGEETRVLAGSFLDGEHLANTARGTFAVETMRSVARHIKPQVERLQVQINNEPNNEALKLEHSILQTLMCSDITKTLVRREMITDKAAHSQFLADLHATISGEGGNAPRVEQTLPVRRDTQGNIGRLLTHGVEPSLAAEEAWQLAVYAFAPDDAALFVEVQTGLQTLLVVTPRALSIELLPDQLPEPQLELLPEAKSTQRTEAWLYDSGFKAKPEFGTPIYELELSAPNLAHPEGMRFKLIGEPGKHISQAKPIGLIVEVPDKDLVVETFPRFDAALFRLTDHYNIPAIERLPRPIEEEPEPTDDELALEDEPEEAPAPEPEMIEP